MFDLKHDSADFPLDLHDSKQSHLGCIVTATGISFNILLMNLLWKLNTLVLPIELIRHGRAGHTCHQCHWSSMLTRRLSPFGEERDVQPECSSDFAFYTETSNHFVNHSPQKFLFFINDRKFSVQIPKKCSYYRSLCS